MMRKILMIFFAAAMPAVAAWCAVGDTFTADVTLGDGTVKMTFKITSDEPDAKECQVGTGTAAIETSSAGELVIPSEADGYAVTSIGAEAFYYCNSLTSVTILGDVTSIGGYAFANCSSLTSITIPEGVTSIGDGVFASCRSLTSITIPEGVTSIGEEAFFNCLSLTSITIPKGVTSIGDMAFAVCGNLTSVTILGNVTSIGGSAFCDCARLTSVTILGDVTSIGARAFSSCDALEYIDMSKAESVDFSRSDMDIQEETLVFLPESKASNITDDDYIVSVDNDGIGTINQIALTEGKDFSMPRPIKAGTVTNNRTLSPSERDAYTLCLPYDLTVPEGMTAYEPSGEYEDEYLVFTEVAGGKMKAYKPYLVTVSEDGVSLSATNVTIVATPAEPEAVEIGGYKLYGTTRKVDNETAAGMGAYILQAYCTWKPVSRYYEEAYVMPFRAYLLPDASGAKEIKTVFANEATGITTLKTVSRDGTTRMYELSGRLIDGKAKGIYIVNGKKFSPTK